MELYDIINDTGHILVFGHADLDGASAAALFKGAVDLGGTAERHGTRGRRWARMRTRGRDRGRVACRMINYGPMEAKALEYIRKWHRRFCGVVFVDYSPTEATCREMDALGVRYAVIDHHQTAYVQNGNPNAAYYMNKTVSGAMGVYNLMRPYLTDAHRELAELADDYDMWRHRIYLSKYLNVAYHNRYGFNAFIRYHSGGFRGIGARVMDRVIRPYYDGFNGFYSTLVQVPIVGNGAYVEMPSDAKYFSDSTMALERKYPWYVIGRKGSDGSTTLAFRTTRDDINLGMTLKSLGMGGGGHAKAAGQRLAAGADVMVFIDLVYWKMTK